jgi:murein DD-endopeptidase MepM/ murein hydrolase activator NlpD
MGHVRRFPVMLSLLLAAAAMSGCADVRERAESLFDTRTARERYEDGLERAGLDESALAREWFAAADRALREPAAVTAPHVEEGFITAADAPALGFRVTARRGQEITFDMTLPGDTTTTVFLDIWYIDRRAGEPQQVLVADADSGARALRHRPRRDGEYIVRAQPELLGSGRFTASLKLAATLAFPVHGGRERDIGSSFGDDRDGGRRSHHGIDIFAPRGTPVVAAAPGVVTRVGERGLGGNVVWMSDADGNRLYYAHLDRWNVEEGQRVALGDTVGFVGNTGNARTTPPHLHFGVYRRGEGPTDPFWFVHTPPSTAPRLLADTAAVGEWVRITRSGVALRHGPYANADSALPLPMHTAARVLAATRDWYRVRLPDGASGYVPARAIERAATPVVRASFEGVLLSHPAAATPDRIVSTVAPEQSLSLLARFGDYWLVKAAGEADAWIEAPGVTPAR